MSDRTKSPLRLKNIGRAATRLKKQLGCRHFEARDLAAKQAGFDGYEDARLTLSCVASLLNDRKDVNRHPSLMDLRRGAALYQDGGPAPPFSGGNDVVIGGWLVDKAVAEADVSAGLGRAVYDALIEVATEYTRDPVFAGTLVVRTMDVLSKLCTPRQAASLREYAEEQSLAFAEDFDH